MSDDATSPLERNRLAKAYACVFLLLTVFVYPLALLPQVLKIGDWYNNLSYQFSFPAFLILGILAVPVIVTSRWRVPLSILVGLGIFTASWLFNYPRHMEYVDDFVMLLGCISIPLCAAILREKKVLTLKNISYSALGFWLLQVVLGSVALYRHQPVTGTPGNINWMAAVLLILSPWVFVALKTIVSQFIDSKIAQRVLALVVLLFPTIILLYHCHSRAAWAAILLVPLALILPLFNSRVEKGLYGGLLFTVLLGGVLLGYQFIPGKLLRVVEQDVRLPLWTSTFRMMIKNPWGVGSGGFQRSFTPYRVGTYHSRLYAADMTIHPHNEFLNVTAQLGIPVALALLLLISPLIRGNYKSPMLTCARLSALFVVFQSCFDMPLVQPPVSFLGFLMIGLCWPLTIKASEPTQNPVRFYFGLAVLGSACIVAGYFAWYDIKHDYYFRLATLRKHIAQKTANESEKFRQAKTIYGKYQKKIGEDYKEAKRLFDASATPFRSLKPNYEAALISLNINQNAVAATERLEKVRGIDPDYAHINILMGRLSLLKKDIRGANYYFSRECMFYPRNSDAWQTMYNFSFRSGQYNNCMDIHKQLEIIYAEKARLTFPGKQLDSKRTVFMDYLADSRKKVNVISRAKQLMNRLNHKAMDPVFIELVMGEAWPSKLLGGSFDDLDYLHWMGRLEKQKQLKKLGDKTAIPEFAKWFCESIKHLDTPLFGLPLTVSKKRKGNALSRYACFSEYINVLGGQCVLQLDEKGQPDFTWVFSGKVNPSKFRPNAGKPVSVIKLDFSDISVYKVDLKNATAESVRLEDVKSTFVWMPKRTVVYFAPEDYFMRTQMLATILGDNYPILDSRPPSLRLLELFWITGQKPPAPTKIKDHCFRPVLDLYKGFYAQAVKKMTQPKKPIQPKK